MRIELCWLLSFWGFAAMALVCGLLAWPQLSAAWPSIEDRIDRFRRQPPLAKVVVLVFIVGFIAYGSTKTNQVDQASGTNEVNQVKGEGEGEQWNLLTGSLCGVEQESDLLCSPSPLDFTLPPTSVTPEDIARGWQLWEVKTNCNISYAMPESAAFATNWWVRGAYEDCSIVRLGDCSIGGGVSQSNNLNNPNNQAMSFPFGTNEYCSVWALTWGKLRFALADTNTEIAAVGAPMSAVPCRSRLWSAADTNGSRLVTWENFALGRIRNADFSEAEGIPLLHSVNAQVELRTTGDFIARSNEVETVYRRVDQEDWDGDGWRNGADPDPYVWDEYWDDFWQELPEGSDANVYYWIDIRPKWNSNIWFYGDGPSDLEDPYIYAKAGETYRVQLLIGKTYDVESDQPFDIVARSDGRVEVSNVEPSSCTVVWPVTLTVAEGRAPTGRPRLGATWNDGGSTFHVLPDPPWLNGRIVWETYCCALQGDGTNFTFACDGNCTCEGCTASGNYIYAGYELPFWSWPCGCGHVDDQGDPGVAIDFDSRVIIYEDAYTNAPGEVVHPDRPNALLRCEVSGGTYGGALSVMLNGAAQQKLRKVWGDELPNNLAIAPGAVRFFVTEYEILEPSGTMNDICATAEFLEDFRNVTHSDDAPMTAVKVELEAVYEAPENPNPSRHVFGVGEKIQFRVTPQISGIMLKTEKLDIGDSNGVYELFDGITNETDASAPHEYVCPISSNYHPPIRVMLGDVEYCPSIELVEPQLVITPEASWRFCHNTGEVGQSKLVTENFIGPMNVSFQGVMITEIPCYEEIAPIGYFATTNFTGYRSHTMSIGGLGAGAGYSRRVQGQNRWTTDEAGGGLYSNWSPGRLEWKIPIGWSRVGRDEHEFGTLDSVERERFCDPSSRPLLIGGRTDKYMQVMTIDEEGTSKIEKFGHWLSRGRYCRIILDGETKQWFHPLW